MLPDAAHGIFREYPERACALLRDFLVANQVDVDASMT